MIRIALTVLCLLPASVACGQELTKDQQAELPRYFGFGQSQIYKLQHGINNLRLVDLNQDGRLDVIVWNGRKSRFELFYQPDPADPALASDRELEHNEVPDRGNLRTANVPIARSVAAIEIADLTDDGRVDIVYYGEQAEITVLPALADGGFGIGVGVRAPDGNAQGGSLTAGDFNSDGRADIALLGSEVLMIFHQKAGGGLAKPIRLVHGIANPGLLQRTDLNGDGRDDLIIGADDERYGAYVCLQEAGGTLAALEPIRVPRLRSQTITSPVAGQKGDDLYAIELTTGRLKHYRWESPRYGQAASDWPQKLHSYPIKSNSKRRPVALGDVDGDGLTDCVAVDPDAAQIILFRGGPSGLTAGTAFPGLVKPTGVCMADIDNDGRAEVLLASAEEKMVGVSRLENGRLTFPKMLVSRGEPFVVAAGGLEVGKPADRLAYVTRDDDVFHLVVAPLDDANAGQEYELEDLDDDPSGLYFADVNQDGRNDLLLFVRYSSPLTYLQAEDGTFELFGGQETRDWLLKEAQPEGFALVDVTGDGKPEVLLAQEVLARALVVRDGRWTVVDQYNPETADARVVGLAALAGGDGAPTLVMYDQKAGDLLVLKRRDDQTYGVAQSMPIGHFKLTAMLPLPIGKSGKTAVLLADAGKLAVLTPGSQAATLVEQHSYETDVKRAWLGDAVVGDINHDGVRDVVVLDMGKAALEVLTTPPGGGFVKAVRFQVFQGKRFSDAPDSRGEPREAMIGDVTDDGIDDVVIVVHDRLIIYPGQ